MNLTFFAIALTMTLGAIVFVATPLVATQRSNARGFAQLPLLAVIAIVLAAIGLYAAIGSPGIGLQQAAAQASGERGTRMGQDPSRKDPSRKDKVGSVGSLVAGLEQRLEQNPDDGGGWLLLAKSYEHLGRYADASDAYAKAAARGVTDAAFADKLEKEPATAAATETTPGTEIRGHIALADGARAALTAGAVVYIVAKKPGERMPLAVLKRSAAELPFDFLLDDADSMMAGNNLSSAGMVTVTALVSNSGNALDPDPVLAAAGRTLATDSGAFVELTLGQDR